MVNYYTPWKREIDVFIVARDVDRIAFSNMSRRILDFLIREPNNDDCPDHSPIEHVGVNNTVQLYNDCMQLMGELHSKLGSCGHV